MKVETLVDCRNDLGEGPVWNATTEELLWVDFNRGMVCTYHTESGQYRQTKVAENVMVVMPTTKGNLLLAAGLQLLLCHPVRGTSVVATLDEGKPANRFNDGKCDSAGRLWIGTMDNNGKEGKGSLYKVEADFVITKMDEGFTIPNGLAWNRQNTAMFMVDSAQQKVFRYRFDANSGEIWDKQVLINTTAEKGLPDGMAIDENDNLWIAFWEGDCVIQYSSHTGEKLQTVPMPVHIPTSCCFGGAAFDTLFVTSSRRYDSTFNEATTSLAGGLFSIQPGCKGFAPNFFKEG